MNFVRLLLGLMQSVNNTKKSYDSIQKMQEKKQLLFVNFFMRFVDKIEANPDTGKKQLIIRMEENV